MIDYFVSLSWDLVELSFSLSIFTIFIIAIFRMFIWAKNNYRYWE